ncbi:MAG: hypothetical protein ABI867_13230 [Kofleriaceae bacterium]
MTTTTRNNGTTNIESRVDSLRDSVKEAVDHGQEKVSELRDRVIDVKDRAMTTGGEYVDKLTDLIKANPMKAVAIAFGAGYIGMRLFRR